MDERRRTPRISPAATVWVRINGFIDAEIVDISRLGIQLQTSSALRPASRYHISLPCGSGILRLHALVHRCRAAALPEQEGWRLVFLSGLEFTQIGDLEQLLLACAFETAHAKAS